MTSTTQIHVVAGIIRDAEQNILLAQRPTDRDHGGYWEFPGGKRELGETVMQTLSRELHEELGIEVIAATPAVTVRHDYPHKSVLLDVLEVDQWHGEASGKEGQIVRWCDPEHMDFYRFPAANRAALLSVRMSRTLLITPRVENKAKFLHRLEACLAVGIGSVQFSDPYMATTQYRDLAKIISELCAKFGAHLILDTEPETALEFSTAGLHLNRARLMRSTSRPCGDEKFLSASCRNFEELYKAQEIGVDCLLISPVMKTASYPDATPLGWNACEELASAAGVPVYALGGLNLTHLPIAILHQCYGLAMMGALWGGDLQRYQQEFLAQRESARLML